MATGTRRSQTGEQQKITGENPAVLDITEVPRPAACLSAEDVEYVVSNLLRLADDMLIDCTQPGVAQRPDAFMRTDIAARVSNVAALVLQRRDESRR